MEKSFLGGLNRAALEWSLCLSSTSLVGVRAESLSASSSVVAVTGPRWILAVALLENWSLL